MLNVSCFSFPNKMGKLLQINMKHTAPFIFFLTEAMSGRDTHTQLASERVEERASSARGNAAVPIRCGWINDSSHFLGGGGGKREGLGGGVGGRGEEGGGEMLVGGVYVTAKI